VQNFGQRVVFYRLTGNFRASFESMQYTSYFSGMPCRWFLLFILFACGNEVYAVNIGDSKQQVIVELGEPGSIITMGATEVLGYGDGKVKLKNGEVVSVSSDIVQKVKEHQIRKTSEPQQKSKQRSAPSTESARQKPATTLDWKTDYAAALKTAEGSDKKILLNFTGSDWCGWCIRLDQEIFSKPRFVEFAHNNLILVKIDFPRRNKLSPALEKQNKQLADRYRIRGFPTILILNDNGKQINQLGYMRGGPEAFISAIEKS